MFSLLRDISINQYTLKVSTISYYDYLLELEYEIKSLLNDEIKEDFHWNGY